MPTGEDEQGKMVPAEKNTESLEKMHEDTEPQKGGKELDVEIKNEPKVETEKENFMANEQTEDDKLKAVAVTENRVETEEGISKETGEKEEKEKRTDLLDSEEEKAPAENRDTEQKEEKGEAQKEAVIDTTTETLAYTTVQVSDEEKELLKHGIDNIKEIGAIAETPISDGDKIPELEDKPMESQAKQVHEIISSEETLSESQDKVIEVDKKLAESENEGINNINNTEETKIKDSGKDVVDQKALENKPEDIPDKLTGMDQNSGERGPENMQENNIQVDKEHLDEIMKNKLQDAVSEQTEDSEVTPVPSISISTEENEKVKADNQGNTETLQQLESENLKENDADSGTGSTADNSSIDLNLSISSFLSKNKETGSISLQVSVSIYFLI